MYDLTVVPLAPRVNGTVVEVLEDLLKQARDGLLESVAVAKVYSDGSSGWNYSSSTKRTAQTGSIAILLNHFMNDP